MAYRDDQEAREARLAALERQARRADQLERRVRELEEENRRLRAALDESAAADRVAERSDRNAPPGDLDRVYVDAKLGEWVSQLLAATRSPAEYGLAELADAVVSGARPEDATEVVRAARARALEKDRKYVVPGDIREVVPEILGPRVILSAAAEARGLTAGDLLLALLDRIELP